MSPVDDARLASWGTADRLTDVEAMMWRAEADPMLRSAGVVLELLDTTPDWDRLVAGHAWGIRRVPRLRERIVDDPTRVGPPAWVPAEVDLVAHLGRTILSSASSDDDVLPLAAELHMSAFDRARPLWRAILVEGLPDGRAAYLLKIHHAMADGAALIQLLDLLHSRRRESTPDKPVAGEPPHGPRSSVAVAARNTRRAVLGSPGQALGTTRTAAGDVARGLLHPLRSARSASAFASSLGRVTGDAPGAPSPLLAHRGLSRRVFTIDAARDDLRAAGKSVGGTLNDAFLAALAGGLRRYHEQQDVAVGDLPIGVPISLRREGDPDGGNRFAGARIALPVGMADPAACMREVRRRVLAAREEPALDLMGMSAPVASRFPTPVLTRMTAQFTTSLDLQASNFRGLGRRAYLAGAEVLRTYPLGPVPGCAMMATLATHRDVCCVGFTVDGDAVTDVPGLRRGFEEAFAEVTGIGEAEERA